MTAAEFKKEWKPDDFFGWTEFSPEQLKRTTLSVSTKDFLKGGFPENAAPFLSFGLGDFGGKFRTVSEYYNGYHSLGTDAGKYWVFGVDGAGNPICMDAGTNDRIVLLDHEDKFQLDSIINKNVAELARCLVAYKKINEQIRAEFGQRGIADAKYSPKHIAELQKAFQEINPDIFTESDFWRDSIDDLLQNC
ncbi:SMI1/KNR4 family protein [Sinomicrobium pectinilyticum]|uniref:SMI1/KNR4 family protein n=1 Tax=Sinomicrobium pectinilyticum TaxID=1084421 RepID=A0A3N0DQT5_SINP1|nr:SMI1/KNR4 family protein [Sinomicrobium pectinilyticum]RNL78004.1 hypothetical protein ED312_20095 [Sinomicrobium pectinilyticum]